MHAFLVDVRLDSADLVEEHAALAAVDDKNEAREEESGAKECHADLA